MVRRQRMAPTDEWQQIELLVRTPEQRTYEVLRPVVLFGQPVPLRASETGLPQSTLYRQAAAFDRDGMASLFPPPMPERHQQLAPQIRQAILDAKREYPALNIHEITTICWARFGHRPSSRTVKRLLAEQPLPPRAARRYPPYRAFDDPVTARLAIVRLHLEGWNAKSIAGYLECSRDTTHRVLKRWVTEGVAGLDDRSHARQGGPRQVDLRAILAVKELQRNPELGEWRVHAALRQQGLRSSPRTCGRILALNRALYGLPKAERVAREPRPMPFQAARRHAIWTVDIRYLDAPDVAGRAYSITILDNFSRAIVASLLSPRQDLVAYLLVLYAAVRQHGAPETLVSDRGGVFLATQPQAIYRTLGITKREIARRQPWQSYIETMFNVQRRMADWDFARAATWAALADEHARWVGNYNQQNHWAHRQRPPDRRSPAAVLGWVGGRQFTLEALHRIFHRTRSGRTLDRLGYLRFRNWRLYGERGLAGEQAAVWLYEQTLTIAFGDEALAQYHVTYQPHRRHLGTVGQPRLYETPHRAPQPYLWEVGDGDWLPVLRLPTYAARQRGPGGATQVPLFPWPESG